MKKNIITTLLICCFTLIALSCSTSQVNVADKSTAITLDGQSKPQFAVSILDSENYEIIKQTYTDRKVTINYPQVTKMSDSSKQEKINELIKADALYKLRWYSNSDIDNLFMKIDCYIQWQSADLLSISYSGPPLYLKGAAHPINLFYTTNIDMHEGSKLRLKDIVKIDSNFVGTVKKGKFISVSPQITLESLRFTNDWLIEAFNTSDSMDYRENKYDTYCYFTRDSLGISMGVSHAYGDHVELEVKYQDIADNIKAKNKIWKSFVKEV